VEEEEGRPVQQPLGHKYLLLVPTAQQAHRPVGIGRDDVERGNGFLDLSLLPLLARQVRLPLVVTREW